jgi:16S rRNA (cytosine1402-N4)-methyltransferase
MSEYHVPVLLEPSLDGLQLKPDGIYVDTTFGGGGHAKGIINRLDDKGHLFVFDQEAATEANLWEDDR